MIGEEGGACGAGLVCFGAGLPQRGELRIQRAKIRVLLPGSLCLQLPELCPGVAQGFLVGGKAALLRLEPLLRILRADGREGKPNCIRVCKAGHIQGGGKRRLRGLALRLLAFGKYAFFLQGAACGVKTMCGLLQGGAVGLHFGGEPGKLCLQRTLLRSGARIVREGKLLLKLFHRSKGGLGCGILQADFLFQCLDAQLQGLLLRLLLRLLRLIASALVLADEGFGMCCGRIPLLCARLGKNGPIVAALADTESDPEAIIPISKLNWTTPAKINLKRIAIQTATCCTVDKMEDLDRGYPIEFISTFSDADLDNM